MEGYGFLFDLALILLSTKFFGLLTRKFKMPQVVGALAAGLILGPAMLNILQETDFINKLSEVGVIVLMFAAGLETDIKELKRTGKASFIIALIGVIVPLGGGFLLAHFFNNASIAGPDANLFLQNIFIGIILTATSVSISVETLKEMGKLNTRAGNAILGAAIIDDILGIVALTVVTSLADSTVNLWVVLLKVVLFFVVAIAAGVLFYILFKKYQARYNRDMRRFVILAFVFCLVLSFCAERYFGVADITGAFIAGLIISNTEHSSYIAARFETLSYTFLSPVFFRQHRPEGGPSGHDRHHYSVLRTAGRRCGIDQDHRMRSGRETLQIQQPGKHPDRRGHGIARRGCADRGKQGRGTGTDVLRVLWPGHHHGGRHNDYRAHPFEDRVPQG